MDKSQGYCSCGASDARDEARRERLKAEKMEKLLAEATELLFVEGGQPSRDLFEWWYRRDGSANLKRDVAVLDKQPVPADGRTIWPEGWRP